MLSPSRRTELRVFLSADESRRGHQVESDDFRGVRKFKTCPPVAAHPR